MQRESRGRHAITGYFGQVLGLKGERVWRMIAFSPGTLDACDIWQVGQRRGRFEARNEGRESGAVVEQDWRAGRLKDDIGAGHRPEELLADDPADRREIGFKRVDQSD